METFHADILLTASLKFIKQPSDYHGGAITDSAGKSTALNLIENLGKSNAFLKLADFILF